MMIEDTANECEKNIERARRGGRGGGGKESLWSEDSWYEDDGEGWQSHEMLTRIYL